MHIFVSTLLRAILTTLMMTIGIPAAVAQDTSSKPDVLSETYRDWIVICRNAPAQGDQPGPRLCEMTQELRQQENAQRVLAIALRPEEEAGAGSFTMVTPFGLKVSEQVVMEIDGVTVVQAPFQTCLPEGCIVQARIEPDGIEIMRKDSSAIMKLPIISGADLEVTISLLGFSAAWNRLSEF